MGEENDWQTYGTLNWWRRDYRGRMMWPSSGQLWRRIGANGEWEYRQDPETDEEWEGWQY